MAQDTPWVASPTGINRERIDWWKLDVLT
jgi:hypothetical protein